MGGGGKTLSFLHFPTQKPRTERDLCFRGLTVKTETTGATATMRPKKLAAEETTDDEGVLRKLWRRIVIYRHGDGSRKVAGNGEGIRRGTLRNENEGIFGRAIIPVQCASLGFPRTSPAKGWFSGRKV